MRDASDLLVNSHIILIGTLACTIENYVWRARFQKCAEKYIFATGYAVDATYTTSCAPPPMMEDLGLGSVAIARPASL